jgi:hypothetical protein
VTSLCDESKYQLSTVHRDYCLAPVPAIMWLGAVYAQNNNLMRHQTFLGHDRQYYVLRISVYMQLHMDSGAGQPSQVWGGTLAVNLTMFNDLACIWFHGEILPKSIRAMLHRTTRELSLVLQTHAGRDWRSGVALHLLCSSSPKYCFDGRPACQGPWRHVGVHC